MTAQNEKGSVETGTTEGTGAEESSRHLTPTITSRGFKHMPLLQLEDGGDLRVYESSSYDPSVWMQATAFVDDGPGAPKHLEKVFLSLSLDEAEQLRDQLTFLVENHFTNAFE